MACVMPLRLRGITFCCCGSGRLGRKGGKRGQDYYPDLDPDYFPDLDPDPQTFGSIDRCSRDACFDYGLDLRGMNFARDVRRQLEGKRLGG